jgi:putative acetyltransferase
LLKIRAEEAADFDGIRQVNLEAFGQRAEADLVEALRAAGQISVSLVALQEGRVVGHILFSPVSIDSAQGTQAAVGLAPMAVLPQQQRQGVGSELIRHGLDACRRVGHAIVVVLGHPEYYPRFGFVPASRFSVTCEYEVPEEVFMALELKPGVLQGHGGTARYQPEFGELDS